MAFCGSIDLELDRIPKSTANILGVGIAHFQALAIETTLQNGAMAVMPEMFSLSLLLDA
jgi:hypothetical protein